LGNNNVFEGRVIGKRDGFTSVKTKHGLFDVPVKKTQPPEGSEVAFVVRLDRLTVNPSNTRDNHFEARFRGKVVNGSLVTYEFVSNDQAFKVETHLSSGLLRLQSTDQVTLGWNSADGYLVTEN
jgi:hypothetical protein